jgi:hypothetical protein
VSGDCDKDRAPIALPLEAFRVPFAAVFALFVCLSFAAGCKRVVLDAPPSRIGDPQHNVATHLRAAELVAAESADAPRSLAAYAARELGFYGYAPLMAVEALPNSATVAVEPLANGELFALLPATGVGELPALVLAASAHQPLEVALMLETARAIAARADRPRAWVGLVTQERELPFVFEGLPDAAAQKLAGAVVVRLRRGDSTEMWSARVEGTEAGLALLPNGRPEALQGGLDGPHAREQGLAPLPAYVELQVRDAAETRVADAAALAAWLSQFGAPAQAPAN